MPEEKEGGAKKGEGVKNKVVELKMPNNGVNNVSEDGGQNGTNSNSNSNGHARHANGCGQRTAGSVHPTNGSYANPLNASALVHTNVLTSLN